MNDGATLVDGTDPPAWRLNPRVRLHWRHLGDAWVLFELLSGQTHQIDNLTAAVLMCFEPGQPLNAPQVLAQLQDEFGMVTQAASVQSVLGQFAALGLIVPGAASVLPPATTADTMSAGTAPAPVYAAV